jgi:hypothetical protein
MYSVDVSQLIRRATLGSRVDDPTLPVRPFRLARLWAYVRPQPASVTVHSGRPVEEESTEVIVLWHQPQRTSVDDGGGGNRTRERFRSEVGIERPLGC